MKLSIRRNDILFSAAVAVAVAGLGAVTVGRSGAAAALLAAAVTGVLLLVLFELHRRAWRMSERLARDVGRTQQRTYQQLESLISVVSVLQPPIPLPPTGGWAALPDFLRLVVSTVLTHRPSLVLETGGGVSTLCVGLALRRLGAGRLISVEHDAAYAEVTRQRVAAYGLQAFVEVVHGPLTATQAGGSEFAWYGFDRSGLPGPIDLLIVDGPPGTLGSLARYPALPVLLPWLSPTCRVLVDDGFRPDETAMVQRWVTENPGFTSTRIETERGAYELHRQ